ncbi:phosphoribosyltransferase [Desulfovibrio inopinatus]|uniref:phosphoribosyltransferase n=1 Tax=Desulfovibrio inopinatus TaxID=102109 RepID=UPI000415334B|nr:phosphoribosyltransferase [Desulfovibrio inopinatus]
MPPAPEHSPAMGKVVQLVENSADDVAIRKALRELTPSALKNLCGVKRVVKKSELIEPALAKVKEKYGLSQNGAAQGNIAQMQSAALVGYEATSTAHEKGITVTPRADRRLQRSTDWKAAKTGDLDAARRIVSSAWKSVHTEVIKAKLNPKKVTVFISVPSTTRANTLPVALGEMLAQRTGGLFIDGGKFYKSRHPAPVKNIAPEERPFKVRDYIMMDGANISSVLDGKNVAVVEDVLTTGASAKLFVRALGRSGIQVDTVAGLMGDPRLNAEPQLVSKLRKAFTRNDINLNAKETASVLSRGEVNVILNQLNKAESNKDDRQAIARDIQRVFNERTTGILGPIL